jgi:Ca-activated chloride channel family protein
MRDRFLLLAFSAVLLPIIGPAQDQAPPAFSARSELVVLQVTVRERNGAYVEGLGQDAFSVIEDGQPQTVRLFSDADTPATVGVLVDGSASMYASRSLVITGAAIFVDASHPRDELFALAFNEGVHPALAPTAPFTRDRAVLLHGLERSVKARGRTALYDAISSGVDYLAKGSRERKALLVLSDGGDNASRTTQSTAVHKAQASGAVIYTVALMDEGARDANPRLLEQLADSSGGLAFRPRDPREFADALRDIARAIRHNYAVAYAPTNPARDGGFRQVRVVVTGSQGRRLVVRTRAGYTAGSSP